MEYKEIQAKTVYDAITQACLDLSITSDRLDYEVISEGSKGFLGIGNKPAVIRYRVLEDKEPEIDIKEAIKNTYKKPVTETYNEAISNTVSVSKEGFSEKEKSESEKSDIGEDSVKEDNSQAEAPAPKRNRDRQRRNRKDSRKDRQKKERAASAEKKDGAKEVSKEKIKEIEPVDRTPEEIAAMNEAAADFLKNVFNAMSLPVQIRGEYERETNCLNIELSGDDMGVLIGKRGQTLDSLQYLTSLCVNRKVKVYVRVKIDTEDYRRRRKETLENLAKNIASKVKKTRKAVVLEPMNPYERRIIHSALQSNNYVETYSEGNEPYRHVVVTPKK